MKTSLTNPYKIELDRETLCVRRNESKSQFNEVYSGKVEKSS